MTESGLALVAVALLGRWTLGVKRPEIWKRLWTLGLGALWLGITAWGLWQERSLFETLTASGLARAVAYGWRASLFLGLLNLLNDKSEEPTANPLLGLVLLGTGLLLLSHPQVELMVMLPLALAFGSVSQGHGFSRRAGSLALAELLEMLSLQAVAWTAVLTVTYPIGEALSGRWLDAAFSFLATGVSGWIFSGLLWGASTTLRSRAC